MRAEAMEPPSVNPMCLVAADLRATDVALSDRPPGHLQHTLQRDAGLGHDFRTKLDPRLQLAERDVQLFERVERHVRAHVAVAIAVPARNSDERLARRGLLHLVDDVWLGRDENRLRRAAQRELEDRARRADMVRSEERRVGISYRF